MIPLRTEIALPKPPFRITYGDSLISIGSCFSENIGNNFVKYKFDCTINPFGQQYNPVSIANALLALMDNKIYEENDLVFHDELYHSFDHHGSFSMPTVAAALNKINTQITQAASALMNADILFITPGTSHVFIKNDIGKVVSNCHKLSGKYFTRRLLSVNEIVDAMTPALARLLEINPDVKLVYTISPVRYLAFGAEENSVSKAHLFTAFQELKNRFPGLFYFPSYEIVMDELRDYRFFSEDMLHPNYLATRYVWEKLTQTFMHEETLLQMKKVEEIMAAASHRPRNPESEQHKKFVAKTLQQIEALKNQLPHLNFATEEKILLANSLSPS